MLTITNTVSPSSNQSSQYGSRYLNIPFQWPWTGWTSLH